MDAASFDALLVSARAELDAVVSALRPFDPKEAGPMTRQTLAAEVARACQIDGALAAAVLPPRGGADAACLTVDATLEALAECHRECAAVAADIRVMEEWLEAKHPDISRADELHEDDCRALDRVGETSAADGGEGPSAASDASSTATAAFSVRKRIVQPPDAASMRRWEVLLARADSVVAAAADTASTGGAPAARKTQGRVAQTDCFPDPHVVARDAFPSAAAIEPVPDIVDAVASSGIATMAMHGSLGALYAADAAVEKTILDEYHRAATGGNSAVVDVMVEALRQFRDGDGVAEEYFTLVAAAGGGSGADDDVARNAAKVLRKALQRAEPQVAAVFPVNARTLTAPGGQDQGVCVLTSHSLQLFSMVDPVRAFAQLAQVGASEGRGGRGSPLVWDAAKVKAAIATWTLMFSVTPQQLRHVSQGFADPLATEKESSGQAQLTTSTFVGGPRAMIVGNATVIVAFDQLGEDQAGAIELAWLVLGSAWNRKLVEHVAPGFKLPRCWCMRQTPHVPLTLAKGGALTEVTPRYDINAGRLPAGSFNPQQAGVFLQDHDEATARIANLSGLSYAVVRDMLFRDPVARWRSLLQVAVALPTASTSSDWVTASNILAAVVAAGDAQSVPFIEVLNGPPPPIQQQQRQAPIAANAEQR